VLAGERHLLARKQTSADLHRLSESLDPLAGAIEWDPSSLVLGLVPPAAEAQVDPASRQNVKRRHHLGNQSRRSEVVTSGEAAHAHLLGRRS
jgi:hypothetical protein